MHLYEQKLARLQVTGVSSEGRTAARPRTGNSASSRIDIELHFKASQGGGYERPLCSQGPIKGMRGDFAVTPGPEGSSIVTHMDRCEFHGGPRSGRAGASAADGRRSDRVTR